MHKDLAIDIDSAQDIDSLLLRDALDQVALNPAASHAWHALMDRYDAIAASGAAAAANARDWLLRALPERTPADGPAGFLRATFAAALTGAAPELEAAVALARTLAPSDPNRVMAFCGQQWRLAARDCRDHAGFVARLRAAAQPELMRLAGMALLAQAAPLAPRPVTELRRIAVIVPHAGPAGHPATGMALEQMTVLAHLGFEVRLFSCQELEQPDMAHLLGTREALVAPPPDLQDLATRLPPGASAAMSDTRLSPMLRWRLMVDMVGEYDPDLVLFVGLCSPLIHALYQARPVLALGTHALAPMAPHDVWLTASAARAGRREPDWGDSMPPAYGHHHPYRARRRPQGPPLARAALRLEPDQLAMISIGASLPDEIGGAWAARMLTVLARHPRLVWVLLGGDGTLPPALAQADPRQLRLVPDQPGLEAVLGCVDLYLNPPRLGDGPSAAEAMAAGLPVLALAGGDAGSLLDEWAQANEAAYFQALDDLLASPALRAGTGAAMRERFNGRLDLDHSGPSLRAACLEALARFRQRQRQVRRAAS